MQTKATANLRSGLVLGGAALLLIWAASWIPVIRSWNDPSADGFQVIPLFWATITMLPLGLADGALAGRRFGARLRKNEDAAFAAINRIGFRTRTVAKLLDLGGGRLALRQRAGRHGRKTQHDCKHAGTDGALAG